METQKTPGLGVVMDLVPGLDGKIWPRVQFIMGVTAFTFTLPAEQFVELLAHLATGGTDVLKRAAEENSPIKVATAIPRNGQHRR